MKKIPELHLALLCSSQFAMNSRIAQPLMTALKLVLVGMVHLHVFESKNNNPVPNIWNETSKGRKSYTLPVLLQFKYI